MNLVLQPWQLLLFILAGWINRQQQDIIEYLLIENQALKHKLGRKRILLNDDQRRRLAVKGRKGLGRKALEEIETIVTPDVSSKQLHQGVEITLQELGRLLHCHGIDAAEDAGRPFDPHLYEAVTSRQDRSQPDHIVLEVIQHGYFRGDKVFRPAKVIVNDLAHSPGPSRVR